MYIYKIEIQNFRNLKKFAWKPNKHINILFGHNGCGKTNVAEALAYLFTTNRHKAYFEKSDYYLGIPENKIIIRAWLDDIESFGAEMSLNIQHIDGEDNFVTDDYQGETKQVLILQLESSDEDKMEWSFLLSTGVHPRSLKDRSAIDYNYIDTSRNPIKEVGMQEKSVLYQLAKAHIGNELDEISKDIVAYANKKLSESKTVEEYLDTLKDMGKLDIIEKYRLLLKNPESSWNSSGYELGTKAGQAQLTFDKQSSGIQNLFLLLLMKKKLEGAGIVFVEELEQSLEPKNQRYIADEYRKMKAGQIFITSHSVDIISHFDYDNIFVVLENGAFRLFEGQTDRFIKEVTRTNKKTFISSMMSENILLVEGESELGSFPIYSYSNGFSFSYLDLDILMVGGKGNFKIYSEAYKKLGKSVFVLLDNDSDVASSINNIKKFSDKIILACNDYEEMIIPYISQYANELSPFVDFQSIKNKLTSINSKSVDECNSHEKTVKEYICENNISIDDFVNYEDLKSHQTLLQYVLHNSFTTTYFATVIANIITEKSGVPTFFADIMDCIKGKTDNLKLKEGETNVWMLQRRSEFDS